ncbi:MAG TPA: holo-ACP synthase [Rhodocyclaceae bacterium]|nr:holo-ACP synthase [Rhodocyclaceae bacterium]
MIHGIGTDIVAVARMQAALDRHGESFANRILAESEMPAYRKAPDSARFLAKRFAAKEAFAKAFGTGLRAPLTLRAIAVGHDNLGKPHYVLDGALTGLIAQRELSSYLSISDEKEYVVAFAVLATQ